MVSRKTLKDLDFSDLYSYYEYILDSQVNGNPSQVKDLCKKLSNGQKREFVHLCNTHYSGMYSPEIINKVIVSLF